MMMIKRLAAEAKLKAQEDKENSISAAQIQSISKVSHSLACFSIINRWRSMINSVFFNKTIWVNRGGDLRKC